MNDLRRAPKVVQINVSANSGSHGRIAEQIGQLVIEQGGRSWIAYGRSVNPSSSSLIKIGSGLDIRLHGVESRLFDNHGLGSRRATRRLIAQLEEIAPDIIHLHNIHGYYLNYPLLFEYLARSSAKVVWTLHDCWPFTGHCAHFMFAGCEKWLTECHDCQLKTSYPASVFLDCSRRNFRLKKSLFTSLGSRLHVVSCSNAVADYARRSFWRDTDIRVIPNGVDLSVFKPLDSQKEKYIIGVAASWPASKGLADFIKLREILPTDYGITLVGLSAKQISSLPVGITGIQRTDNSAQLAELYSKASCFVNPTYEDNFPTVNLEALACGTPVVTYRTGGSPEAVDSRTGIVVERGDVAGLAEAVKVASGFDPAACRQRAVSHFNKDDCFKEYIKLYNELIT